MKIGFPRQTGEGETRAPATPAMIKKLVALKVEAIVESGLGAGAGHADEAYLQAGALVVSANDARTIWDADIVVTLNEAPTETISRMREHAVLVGMLDPTAQPERVSALISGRVTSFSMEFLPRISRAQAMDVLSSQANLGGYMAVVLGAANCPKIFPMLMTAAGTIAPARVFVLGAGVAGLQAIATARRLGAIVEAFDIRPAVNEQIQSLGARFVELGEPSRDGEAQGGYARELTDEEKARQAEQMAKHLIGADVVVSTAAVPGKAPPILIPQDVVDRMNPGSVIVDLAASLRHGHGNCAATHPGQTITTDNGVVIIGETNMPARSAVHASQMYAANMLAFLGEIVKEGALAIQLDDEIQAGCVITHEGALIHDRVKAALPDLAPHAAESST